MRELQESAGLDSVYFITPNARERKSISSSHSTRPCSSKVTAKHISTLHTSQIRSITVCLKGPCRAECTGAARQQASPTGSKHHCVWLSLICSEYQQMQELYGRELLFHAAGQNGRSVSHAELSITTAQDGRLRHVKFNRSLKKNKVVFNNVHCFENS